MNERPDRGVLWLVHDLIRPYRGRVAIVFVAMLVETAAGLAAPWPLKVVIDNILGAHPLPAWLTALQFLNLQSEASLVLLAAVSVVAITACGAVASYIDNYYTESVGQWVGYDLRIKVYHHLHRLSLAYYDKHRTGAMLSTLIDDVDTIQSFASSATLSIAVDLLTIAGMLLLMLALNWSLAAAAFILLPFLILFVIRFKRVVKRATRDVRAHESEVVSVVQQGLESIRTVEAFGREDLEEMRLSAVTRSTVEAALRARRIKSLLSPIVSVTVAGATAFVLWRGTALILAGTMTVGALTVFLAYLNRVFKPVQELAKMTNTVVQASVALERTRDILDADVIIPEKPGAPAPETLQRDIVFDHVAFAYEEHSPVLRDVNFTVQRGQRVGIVGPTGGGKSTVVSLIPRFYDVTGGRVLVDGVDVRDYSLHGLRSQIGFVLQDTTLFRGTVRENIAYGRPEATEAEIVEAARLANAHEFIEAMSEGYGSMVGERGVTLSGGQRQRIGIARAIVRNSPILILDEPTAALDPASEHVVMEGLERLMAGRTVITVAHRLSTIRDAHKILVIAGGMVAEQGTHDELVARGGIFTELHKIQTESAEPGSHAAARPVRGTASVG